MVKKGLRVLALLFSLSLFVVMFSGCDSKEDEELPAELQAVADNAVAFAKKCARQLNGEWGDKHALLIESGEGEEFPDFEEMQAVLRGFVVDSGISYIYAMYPPGPKFIAPYVITVDGSLDVTAYGTPYEWEEAFTIAWEGEAAVSLYAWTDHLGSLVMSAYSPVYNSERKVTAIIGVDYPAPEAALFPDWIRDEE